MAVKSNNCNHDVRNAVLDLKGFLIALFKSGDLAERHLRRGLQYIERISQYYEVSKKQTSQELTDDSMRASD